MNPFLLSPALALASLLCAPLAPHGAGTLDVPGAYGSAVLPTAGPATSAGQIAATGSFVQTGITSLQVKTSGPGGKTTIIDQTSFGTIDGTLSGDFEDDLMVVIRPNGTFSANFTLTVDCTLEGKQGVVTFQAADVGQLLSPTTAQFSGVAAITGATGELDGLHGVLQIEGQVDLVSGLSTYAYEGTLQTTW